MPRRLTGIRRMRAGWQANVRINGHLYHQQFSLNTPIAEMREWREQQIAEHDGTVPEAGSFRAAIAAYLERISAMPTYKQKRAHLELWAAALGGQRAPASITDAEIDIVLQGWLSPPPDGPGISPGTALKRRTSLQSFFGGKRAKRNPVRGTARPAPADPEGRALDYGTIAAILAAMPARLSAKRGTDRGPALGTLRAAVLAYTGMPPGMLGKVKPSDLQLAGDGAVRVSPRRKGRGVAARTLPLTPDGRRAFADFHAADAYGRFAVSSLNVAFKRAAARAGCEPGSVHLYDLRHSFLTELYRVTRDLATVARFAMHSEGSPITARYAKGANVEVDRAAAASFSTALAEQRRLLLKPAPKLRAEVARRRQSA